MIAFESIAKDIDRHRARWLEAEPFEHLVIDGFLNPDAALQVQDEFPNPEIEGLRQSRDYMFAKNKYEKSGFWTFGPACKRLYDELLSKEFAKWLSQVRGREVWVDPDFHGGGMHQGAQGSFLDMHTDFNVHPLHGDWFRDLNVLIYLNPNWKPGWGGGLKLQHRKTGKSVEIDPVFGRCVIMKTRDYTLHGYDPIKFPPGEFRRTIACYAYSPLEAGARAKSTAWYPTGHNPAKRVLGRLWPHLVVWKNRVWGSSTAKNR